MITTRSKFKSAALATALFVTPLSATFSNTAQAANPATQTVKMNQPPAVDDRTIIRKASDYSETYPVAGVVVFKGKQNEDNLTGAQIGNIIVAVLRKMNASAKAFVEEPSEKSGEYTTVIFLINGDMFGPMGLGDVPPSLKVVASLQRGSVMEHPRTLPAGEDISKNLE